MNQKKPKKIMPMTKAELERRYQTLLTQNSRYRILAEQAPAMLWLTNPEGKSLFFNKKWLHFTGFGGADEPAKVWVEALHPEQRQATIEDFKAAFAAQRPFQLEYLLRRHDGQYRWLLDIGEPYHDQQGLFIGFVGFSQDITERKQAEETLRDSFGKLDRHNRETELLGEMSACLQVCHCREETYPVIQLYAQRLFPGLSGLVGLINESRSIIETIVSWGKIDSEQVFDPDQCWALRQGKSHRVDHPNEALHCWHINSDQPAPYLCLPMTAYGETRGLLYLAQTERPEAGMEGIEDAARIFANQTALALANLRLKEALQRQSVRDPLTQLFNRRYLTESLERELARAKREQKQLGILMVDIDHFKKYNDTHGHDAGDTVLRAFSQLLSQQTRKEDLACRYGGEEFVMLMVGINPENLAKRAEALCKQTQMLSLSHRNAELDPITISIGAAWYPVHGETPEQLITVADEALYQAKRGGRNRVQLAHADQARGDYV
ncbi:MAG: diguanylate cyclase [Methylococcales bacterium]|nr:diguanylate cyclase [Methylococcales bacterium]